ncbi:cytochrome P450 [Dendryphion nanum]|uniref:Cytochrome P450 n=1 Tax=Dendryphion nanum TaxID=256645 RepID=A0A9P9EEK3_9PLEO|nr:cytochrome P450 [Dendryphion nanum]
MTTISTVMYDLINSNALLVVTAVPLLALLLWRFWRFTIRPLLHPLEPRELPYWIPYLGHVRSFFKDYNAALEVGRTYFNDTKEPYSVWLAGTRINIVTHPNDVANCYKNTTTISYHHIIKDMYRYIHVSDEGVEKMFTLDPEAPHNRGQAKPLMPAYAVNELHRVQVHPGENFDDLLHNRFTPGITKCLDFDSALDHPAVLNRSKDSFTVSSLELCNELFVRGTTEAFLGKSIWKVNPNLLKAFRQWERTNWKYMFQMPNFMSGDMMAARDEIIDTFVRYFRLPKEERSDCNLFIREAERLIREVDISELDMAKVFMLHFWAILGNIYKVGFWAIAHLAYDPKLLDAIRTEVSPAMKDGVLKELYLYENCPKVESLVSEMLRMTVASALVREVIAPTDVGGKILMPGSKLLIPYRQLHLNRDAWGADPLALDPFRFAANPKMQNSKAYRPFGGGNTLCPGRFIAKRSMCFAVALLVNKFDLEIDPESRKNGILPPFPKIDTTKPSPGASLPHEGDDVILVLKKRALAS